MPYQIFFLGKLKSAFRKAISSTARNAISLLCRAATSAVSIRSGGLAELIAELSSGGPCLFLPYASADCLALHTGISKRLQSKGLVSNHSQIIPFFSLSIFISKPAHPQSFSQFQERLRNSLANSGLDDLYYPVLDTIIASISYDLFESGISLSPSFYEALHEHYLHLEEICQDFQACFLADSAYLNNHAIKQIMLKSGKPVFYLNPRGQFRRYNDINYSEFSSHPTTVAVSNSEEACASRYLAKRFAGKSKRDLDSSSSFAKSAASKAPNKKILFLHAFRDANNNSWIPGQAFDSYYEWVDFTLSVIAQAHQFEQWYIKPHPSRHYYQDDEMILDKLLINHNVPVDCLENIPSTSEVLSSQMPVYTNNGTIILEAASLGQAAFFCGSGHHPSLGHHASSKDEWAKMLLMPKLVSDSIGIDSARLARYSLWNSFDSQNIAMLCPSRQIMPRETSIHKIALLLSQIRNSLFSAPCVVDIPHISP